MTQVKTNSDNDNNDLEPKSEDSSVKKTKSSTNSTKKNTKKSKGNNIIAINIHKRDNPIKKIDKLNKLGLTPIQISLLTNYRIRKIKAILKNLNKK